MVVQWVDHYLSLLVTSQQTFVGLEDVFNTSSAQQFYVFQDVLKTAWKTKNCYAEDVLKTCLEDVLKALWRQAKYLLGISVFNKSKCVSNKSIFNKSTFENSKANPKCIK